MSDLVEATKCDELKDASAELSTREEQNSAIGSWSGYIYQGLCGLLVVLRMIRENREQYHGYSLQLDAYEDFSIFNENNKIYSLHQCKSIKGQTDYEEEFEKIEGKKEANKDLLLHPEKPLYYFHCNCDVAIDEKFAIEAYPFKADKRYCAPGEIQQYLNEEISFLKKEESDTDTVRAALETLVNGEVLGIQQKYFEAKSTARLWKISRNQRIPFSKIEDIIDSTIMRFALGDFLNQMKFSYIIELEDMASEEGEVERQLVESFINEVNAMNPDELKRFLQRINPKERIEETHQCWHEIASKERIHWLYNLIAEFPLDSKALYWQTTNSIQTPSTLGNDEKLEKQCAKIDKNQANLDFPWIYDWIVGHVEDHVDNISDMAKIITKSDDPENRNSIFRTKKVGILTIKEKRDGTFD